MSEVCDARCNEWVWVCVTSGMSAGCPLTLRVCKVRKSVAIEGIQNQEGSTGCSEWIDQPYLSAANDARCSFVSGESPGNESHRLYGMFSPRPETWVGLLTRNLLTP